jgi:hypothetical protein
MWEEMRSTVVNVETHKETKATDRDIIKSHMS